MKELSGTEFKKPDHCYQCKKPLLQEKIILMGDQDSIVKMFCSLKCKWNYQVLMLRRKLEVENCLDEKIQSDDSV